MRLRPIRPSIAFVSAYILLLVLYEDANGQVFFSDSGNAEFVSSVPLHEFSGTSDQLTGQINLADSTVDFYLDLSTLKTGIGKRDRDMRLTLDTDDYPFAEFYGKLVSGFDESSLEPQTAIALGKFTIHGVSREVEIAGSLEMKDDALLLCASWELKLTDYEITPPRLLIVKVDDVQKVKIEISLFKRSDS